MLITGFLYNLDEITSVHDIKKYSLSKINSNDSTYHEYPNTFPLHLYNCLNIISKGVMKKMLQNFSPLQERLDTTITTYKIEPIDGMNEIYASNIGGQGSDRVFETKHVDGPFFWLPYCHVYRCIVAVSGNKNVHTSIEDRVCTLNTLCYAAFDYNRDIHYIYKTDECNDLSPRILLKLHYIIYPSYVPKYAIVLYKALHICYNSFMRKLFLLSQINSNQKGILRTCLAACINIGTYGFCTMIHSFRSFWPGPKIINN